jgi:hypothetical protein
MSEIERIERIVRIEVLNAVIEIIMKYIAACKIIDEVSLNIRRALEAEMDDAASDRTKQWKMR